MSPEKPAATKPLKRLGFVHSSSSYAYTTSETLYRRLRAALERVETGVAPYVSRATELGEQLLLFADAKVDYLVVTADKTLTQGRSSVSQHIHTAHELAEANRKAFASALDSYLSFLTKAGEYVVVMAKDTEERTRSSVSVARGALQAAVEKARGATDPDVSVQLARDAWTKFASYPTVAKILDTAEPATKLGVQAFHAIHDTVVANPLYKAVFDATVDTVTFATTTTPYKLGAQYLYPMVQPVAEPAMTKVSQSKVVHEMVDYWKPRPFSVAAH